MKKNIVWYIGFIISIVGLVLLWRSYGIAAWLMGCYCKFWYHVGNLWIRLGEIICQTK